VFERIKAEQASGAAVRIERVLGSSIENGSHQSILIDAQPGATGEQVLPAIDPWRGVE